MTHLSAEQLGDVDAIAGHEHLRSCRRCYEQWTQQRAVRDLLRELPDPGGIPPDVATGLAHAFRDLTPGDGRADASHPGGRTADHAPVPQAVAPGARSSQQTDASSTVVPLPSRPDARAGRPRPWLAAAAAVIVLGGGGAALVSHPWSAGGAGDAASGVSSRDTSGGAREGSGAAVDSAAARVRSSGTDYQRAGLAAQVRRELLQQPASGAGSPAPGVVGDGSGASGDTRLSSPEGLGSCLSALGVDAGQVTAVDLARFDGAAAALVVLTAPDGAHDVWVVGRDCRQGHDKTRYFVRLP